MAVPKICSIFGCGKPHFAHSFCNSHYKRYRRNGDPLGLRTPNGEPQRYFREVVLTYGGNECLKWPFAHCKGYGQVVIDGRKHFVTRLACEAENGQAPTPDHEAAHSCGNGDDGCCTKRHLSWKTHVENHADRIIHETTNRGGRNGQAKLTESEAREILSLKGQMSQRDIAAKFGVCRWTVSDIMRRRNWGWL